MASPFANLVLMAAHVVLTVPSAHDGLEELLAQAHAAVARHPEALNPRLQRAALYRQHEEWELAALDLQAAIKISGPTTLWSCWGRLNRACPRPGGRGLPLLLQLLNKENMSLVAHDRLGRVCPIEAVAQLHRAPPAVVQEHPEPGPKHSIALSEAHRSAKDLEQAMAVLTQARKKFGPPLPLEDRLANLSRWATCGGDPTNYLSWMTPPQGILACPAG